MGLCSPNGITHMAMPNHKKQACAKLQHQRRRCSLPLMLGVSKAATARSNGSP